MSLDFDTLIFDRSQADLSSNSPRAYHNLSDLKRINHAIGYLGGVFNQVGMTNTVFEKLSWSDFEYSAANIGRMVQDIGTLRSMLQVSTFTPTTPFDFNRPTLEKANDIEQILHDIYQLGDFFLSVEGRVLQTADEEVFLYASG